MFKLFTRNLYIKPRNDTDAELKIKGSPVQALILSVVNTKNGYVIHCSPIEGDQYSDRIFVSKALKQTPSVRIGGTITVYIDEFDCDGQYFVDVPVRGEKR